MSSTSHNPADTPPPAPGFAHATSATGSRIIHISGQVGTDATGQVVEGGLAAQTVVDWEPSKFEALGAAGEHYGFPETAVTLVGVAALFTPEHLIEIEGVAVAE